MNKIKSGDVITPRELEGLEGERVSLPHANHWTHLQFRRFAGCPICSLHLQSFLRRHAELQAQGIQEIVVFHSGEKQLRSHFARAPFAIIADPHKRLYAEFGVDTALRSVFNPASWPAAIGGVLRFGPSLPARGESALGLPADFLIDHQGRIRDCNYGRHADDQWTLDELLTRKQRLCAED